MTLEKGGVHEILELDLNEFGDLAAGFAAPMALVWLIAGYFQQQVEIRQNTAALDQQDASLRLQVDELKCSVEAQLLQAATSREQLTVASASAEFHRKEMMRSKQPLISMATGGSGAHRQAGQIYIDVQVQNHGHALTQGKFTIHPEEGSQITFGNGQVSESIDRIGAEGTHRSRMVCQPGFVGEFAMSLHYTDGLGDRQCLLVTATKKDPQKIKFEVHPWSPLAD
ncbi:hypothetical protein [Polycyclovorans algicola]|uniref:hypothetical protein n=1 Tax=Polycyclovorans algicola TaxID=616992 RepID=UPI001267B916|nr:hypothetical protein [Polycyclovorans algicola]